MNLQLIFEVSAYISSAIGLICIVFGLIIRKRLAGHLANVINWVLIIALGFVMTQANYIASAYFGFEEMIGRILIKLVVSVALLGVVWEICKMIKFMDSKKDGWCGRKKRN